MKVQFSFWEVESITASGMTSTFPPVYDHPRSAVQDVKNLAEVIEAREVYAKTIPDHICGQVFSSQKCRDRAISKFKALPLLMVNRHIGEAAGAK